MATPETATSSAEDAPLTHAYVGSERQMLIGGEWIDAAQGGSFETINPATEEVICTVPEATGEDVDRAVKAARKAFSGGDWPKLRAVDRERLLHKLADLIDSNRQELAELESIDNGKPVHVAGYDMTYSEEFTRYIAGWPSKLEGRTIPSSTELGGAEFHAYTRREPVGVVGAIIPWNFPFQMAVSKLAPALAAGCTVVLKPAEQTPLTALRLGELVSKAGFPAGVVNILTGDGPVAGRSLVEHPDVDKIAFTGSTVVGKEIAAACAQNMTRVTLELGGKSPVIVDANVDIDRAVTGASRAIFGNMGQVCVAGSRLYVHEDVYDDVIEGVAGYAGNLRIGPGHLRSTQQGPLVSEHHMNRVLRYIDAGQDEGGTVVVGGERHGDKGWYVEPTVFTDLDNTATIVREEIFGPVLVAQPYSSADDLAHIANDSPYGLAASIWTEDVSLAHRLSRRIQAGLVWVNCHSVLDPAVPFGGYKQSGVGRENGAAGVEAFTELKSTIMRI